MIHIHNGDAVAGRVRTLALAGEHIVFREALMSGPVTPDLSHDSRARFLSAAYGDDLLRASHSLFEQEQALDAAEEGGEEIVLWFEHDLFCLIHLMYLLQRFDGKNVSMVWSEQLLVDREPAELSLAFESRRAVIPSWFAAAARAWDAYTSADPQMINALLGSGSREIPFLHEGLALHASRFPSVTNGLGSIEERLLRIIGAATVDFAAIFERFDDAPPRLGITDLEMLRLLRNMATCANPLVTIATSDDTPPKMSFTLTPVAGRIMASEVDALSVNDPDEWLGGVHLTKENVWRWDANRGEIVPNPSAGS